MDASRDSLPTVTVHYAQTLDGRIATRTGQSRWISSESTLRYAHLLRAAHQAVLVGVGTVRIDDPQLTVRLAPGRSPLRVVLDSRLTIPINSKLLDTRGVAETLVITTSRADNGRVAALEERGARVAAVSSDGDHVDLYDALRLLKDLGVHSVLVEGGARTITSFLRAGLVTHLSVCVAAMVLGEGISAVGDLAVNALDEALRLRSVSWKAMGTDLVLEADL